LLHGILIEFEEGGQCGASRGRRWRGKGNSGF